MLFCGATIGPLVACGDESTSPRSLSLCRSPVEVAVSAGVTPTFDWSPACRVSFLRVRESATGLPMWTLFADPLDGRAIVPSVRYGNAPPGVIIGPQPAADLEAGTTYVLTLRVAELLTGEIEVADQEFTP